MMNKSEIKALDYLKRTEHKDIIFRSNKTPDFKTNKGYFEVKRGYKLKTNGDVKILFYPDQINKIIKCNGDVLVFLDENDPVDIIKPSELKLEKIRHIIITDLDKSKYTKTTIMVNPDHIKYIRDNGMTLSGFVRKELNKLKEERK